MEVMILQLCCLEGNVHTEVIYQIHMKILLSPAHVISSTYLCPIFFSICAYVFLY